MAVAATCGLINAISHVCQAPLQPARLILHLGGTFWQWPPQKKIHACVGSNGSPPSRMRSRSPSFAEPIVRGAHIVRVWALLGAHVIRDVGFSWDPPRSRYC